MPPPARAAATARRQLRAALATALSMVVAACVGQDSPRPQDPEPSGFAELRSYKETHYRAIGSRGIDEFERDDLLAEATRTGLLFLGDHHRDPRLHVLHRQLLEALLDSGTPVVLAVECVGSEDQAVVDAYLSGWINESALRRGIRRRWPDSWLDLETEVDSAHYRQVLRLARARGLQLLALEPAPRMALDQRDAVIATNLRRIRGAFPNHVTVVMLGHAHLLGAGHVVERVGAPATVVLARPSTDLAAWVRESIPRAEFLRTDAGAILPLLDHSLDVDSDDVSHHHAADV